MANHDFFSAGVAPGGLFCRDEIRTLLCDLAAQLTLPFTITQAEAVFVGEGLANYFEFHAALHELTQQGKLLLESTQGQLCLVLPDTHHHAAATLAKELPRRVRDRALHAAEQLQLHATREADNRISVYPTEDGGFYITFRQGESNNMLLSVTVYAPDAAEAERIRQNFLKNPGQLYRAVLGAL
ncbi:MAG: DUF4364 family protein [Oscillospiraceae bacterium]|nr:DUF4364 family protein [Oscillospiraceae bacterium]